MIDPRETFTSDQESARAEAATRDEQQWAAGLRAVTASAARVEATTALVRAVAGLVSLVLIAGIVALLALPVWLLTR